MTKMTEEQVKQAIDTLVDEALSKSSEVKSEEVVAEEPVAKSEEASKEEAPAELAKAEDCKEEPKEEAKEEKKPEDKKKMKKSVEELAEHLSDDELELIKAWREENDEMDSEDSEEVETAVIDVEEIVKSVKASVVGEFESLKKALSDKDDMIKSLTEKVETISKQPAYERRSLETLEVIEKGGEEQPISKAQVLDKMLDMQRNNEGIRSTHVAEFEATGNISDPAVKAAVFGKFKS